MNTIQDIDTTSTAPAAITIDNDKQLCDAVYLLASKQLIINAAEADMQSRVEGAKKAFADATGPLSSEVKSLFAAVEAYAKQHRDRLFPVKGAKRKKTFAVLQHKLQYRTSEQVKAPANAAEIIINLCDAGMSYLSDKPGGEWNGLTTETMKAAFKPLIRQPEPEMNKEALKDAPEAIRELLRLQGIRTETLETFKLVFSFTPEQEAVAS